jgi:hypothetical protein
MKVLEAPALQVDRLLTLSLRISRGQKAPHGAIHQQQFALNLLSLLRALRVKPCSNLRSKGGQGTDQGRLAGQCNEQPAMVWEEVAGNDT